jgi:hypothetical protein
MLQTDLLKLTRKVPFEPFRLTLTNGENYTIRHPDMIMPTPGSAFIGIPTSGQPDLSMDWVIVSLTQILKFEPAVGSNLAKPTSTK